MYERAEDFPELVELLRVLYKILHSAKVYPKSEALCEIIYYEDYLDEKYGRRKDAVRTAAWEEFEKEVERGIRALWTLPTGILGGVANERALYFGRIDDKTRNAVAKYYRKVRRRAKKLFKEYLPKDTFFVEEAGEPSS